MLEVGPGEIDFVNAKTRCWDLEKVCAARKVPLRKAFSAGRDRYVRHNRGCSGAAYVYLRSPQDAARVQEILVETKGVKRVLRRQQAAREHRLMPSRIGDFVVWGDQNTLFGEMDTESETFAENLRSHGSKHELDIPLLVYNAKSAPRAATSGTISISPAGCIAPNRGNQARGHNYHADG